MIRSYASRFGTIDIDDTKLIHFPNGLIGFPEATLFALLETAPGRTVAYLQSLQNPALAFPVIDGGTFGAEYPPPAAFELAAAAGIDAASAAVLIVVATAGAGNRPTLVANLLAPVIIDARGRHGAQVVLDPTCYSASFTIESTIPRRSAQEQSATRETTVNHETAALQTLDV